MRELMQNSNRLNLREFIKYKFLNSAFTGISVGSIFTIYAPLKPSIYSMGGILLAISMLFIAKLYSKILNFRWFYRISLMVEVIMLILVCYFLFFSYSYATALFIYSGYQLTFAFGSYLLRAETVIVRKNKALTFIDVAKQKGYLFGLFISYVFYKVLEFVFGITDNKMEVYYLHYLLLAVEIVIIYFLLRAFSKKSCKTP